MKKVCVLIILFVAVCLPAIAETAPDFTGWKQAETGHFRFIYEDASKEAAEGYALIADDAWNRISKVYSLPADKIDVAVTARTNTVNAYTYLGPLSIGMFTSPVITPDFTFRENWQRLFFLHELTHAANSSFEERSNLAADVFGPFFRMLDFSSMSSWYAEGLTTVLETELTDGGRGRSPYFELLFKAPAMEGSLLSYDEIGSADEPPRGQIYVMGYLVMRSLADRFGLDVLADIERNRATFGSSDDAVYLTTGFYAPDIYRDAKISLIKYYAQERLIPEGRTITPRDTNSYYFQPAVILDDGTFIMLKKEGSDTAKVVRYNQANPVEMDEEGNVRETELFAGSFPDQYSVTASEDGTVWASLAMTSSDQAPGPQVEYQIYRWTDEGGLIQLTSGSSYFQPAASRDGSVLVAVEQSGMHMRLVRIDTETGAVTPLLEDEGYSFIQPAVNSDGSKVAFLRVEDKRAAVCYLDLTSPSAEIKVVANGSGAIIDPSLPHWDTEDMLSYCANTRGRLEVFAVSENADGTYTSTPVVSDPVGALWAEKRGPVIYYASYASSGNVVKVKPDSEWGVVPDFNGPSMPGEIMRFGDLQEDYVDYPMYAFADKSEYLMRNEELAEYAAALPEPVTQLQNEKPYTPGPQLFAWLPGFSMIQLPDQMSTIGWGATVIGMTPLIQMQRGIQYADLMFYPDLMNFSADLFSLSYINNTELQLMLTRCLRSREVGGSMRFEECNIARAGLAVPFYSRTAPGTSFDITGVTSLNAGVLRHSTKAFAVTDPATITYPVSGAAGIDLSGSSSDALGNDMVSYDVTALGLGVFDVDTSRFYAGAEGAADVFFGTAEAQTGFRLVGRYADMPEATLVENSLLRHAGKPVDFTDPLNFVCQAVMKSDMSGSSFSLYEEALVSMKKNGSWNIDPLLITGYELSYLFGRNSFIMGCTANYNMNTKSLSLGGMYFTIKMLFGNM